MCEFCLLSSHYWREDTWGGAWERQSGIWFFCSIRPSGKSVRKRVWVFTWRCRAWKLYMLLGNFSRDLDSAAFFLIAMFWVSWFSLQVASYSWFLFTSKQNWQKFGVQTWQCLEMFLLIVNSSYVEMFIYPYFLHSWKSFKILVCCWLLVVIVFFLWFHQGVFVVFIVPTWQRQWRLTLLWRSLTFEESNSSSIGRSSSDISAPDVNLPEDFCHSLLRLDPEDGSTVIPGCGKLLQTLLPRFSKP